MKQSWDDYEKAADAGPLALALKVVAGVVVLCAVISVAGYGLGWFSSAAKVARQEYGAEAALRKYEWFKDAAAQLQKKQADIRVYETRMSEIARGYGDAPRSQWDRTDREALNVQSAELAGVKASYNQLAAEYNSASSKFNWSGFQGEVPRVFQEMVAR